VETRGQASAGPASPDPVVETINPAGAGAVVLVCEHAANHIPPDLGDLGVTADVLASHVAWDPGALAVARALSAALDAPLVAARVSRLVYDCNRAPDADSAIPAVSEVHPIPGNAELPAADRQARAERFYAPFRDAVAACLDGRAKAGRPTVLVTVHSFAPVFNGVARDVDIGILHDSDARFADAMLQAAAGEALLTVRRNAPYSAADGVTHTLRTHAVPRGLLNVMIEIRNDLIADAGAQAAMARRLAGWIGAALAATGQAAGGPPPLAMLNQDTRVS